MSTDHVRIMNHQGGYLMFCEHCGTKADTFIQPPLSVNVMLAMVKAYTNDHKNCKLAVEDGTRTSADERGGGAG